MSRYAGVIASLAILAGCSWPAPVEVPVPTIIIEEPGPAPIVKEVFTKPKPRPDPNSEFFCSKPELKGGSYYGIIDDILIRFDVRQYGKHSPPSSCHMSFDKFSIEDRDCNGSASEFYTPSLSFNRKPPIIIDWKKVDRILKLGHRLVCEKNTGDNNKRLAEIESENAFKLFKGIE